MPWLAGVPHRCARSRRCVRTPNGWTSRPRNDGWRDGIGWRPMRLPLGQRCLGPAPIRAVWRSISPSSMGTVALTMMTFSACLLLTQRRVGVGDLPTTAEGTAGRPHHFQRFERVDLADAVQIFYKKGALLVDVREERYFSNGHVRGAINIPLSVLALVYELFKTCLGASC